MKDIKKMLVPYLVVFVVLLSVWFLYSRESYKVHDLTYDEFIREVEKNTVDNLELTPKGGDGVYELRGKLKGYKENESYFVRVPISNEVIARLITDNDLNYEIKVNPDPNSANFWAVILNVGTTVLLIGGAFFLITRQVNSGNKSFDFGKSKAKLSDKDNKVTFDDVAGLTEEKEEVSELIDFLRNPKKFERLGARIPTGVMLVGPPGTGKTLLARAVAGEADVPFYYISGSDFVEMFVGVGASRVRDMFKKAKANAPCLIFIDEIDAVGRQRGTGLGGGHDEREQTLNQLLTEMDGFGENEGIIILAATNRPDVLDPALLRPGRFDREVTVGLPDARAREEILIVHARNKFFAKDVDLSNIAKRTVGLSGADLENLLNEAALLAVRRDEDVITMSELDEAHDRVLMGPAKVTKKYSEEEKRLVAYHEAGHAVIGLKLEGAHIVQKVTIIPRGNAGGYNLMLPKEEKITATRSELISRIVGLLGGRVAEEVEFDDITTGAHNDFEKATKIARAMVTEYGMSSLGPVQFDFRDSDSVFLGRDYGKSSNVSSKVAYEIDQEMRRIIEESHKTATKIITDNKDLLDLIASSLMEHETLTKEQIDSLLATGKLKPDEKVTNDYTVSELKNIAKDNSIKGYNKMNKEELLKELGEIIKEKE